MKLSIITINYNNYDGLQKTIDSVRTQTFKDYEWIVIDGGSVDGSRELIEQYADCFSYWVSEQDNGIYNAMNKGTKVAVGEYCLYLNSGDFLYKPTTLEDVFSKKNSEDLIWGRILYSVSDTRRLELGFRDTDFTAFELFRSSLPHQACFIKRDILLSDGLYDETYEIVSDLGFFYNCVIYKHCSLACLDMIISVVDGHGISSDFERSKLEEERLFCEFYPSRLLKDYQEWMNLKEENALLRLKLHECHNAIALYELIKKHSLIRKFHTLFYKLLCEG